MSGDDCEQTADHHETKGKKKKIKAEERRRSSGVAAEKKSEKLHHQSAEIPPESTGKLTLCCFDCREKGSEGG